MEFTIHIQVLAAIFVVALGLLWPEFGELLNSLQLGGQGKTVSLGFSIPSEVIDALAAIAAPRPSAGVVVEPTLKERRPLPAL